MVLDYLRSLGHIPELSLKDLHKTATLMALCTVGRLSDLSLLSINHFPSITGGLNQLVPRDTLLRHARACC